MPAHPAHRHSPHSLTHSLTHSLRRRRLRLPAAPGLRHDEDVQVQLQRERPCHGQLQSGRSPNLQQQLAVRSNGYGSFGMWVPYSHRRMCDTFIAAEDASAMQTRRRAPLTGKSLHRRRPRRLEWFSLSLSLFYTRYLGSGGLDYVFVSCVVGCCTNPATCNESRTVVGPGF